MATGKREPPSIPPAPAQAARVADLVSGKDPEAQKALADRHLAKTRKKAKSSKSMPAVRAGARDLAGYLRPLPTRSRVLNAFLHEAAGVGLVPPAFGALDERALAPRLVEIARKYMAPMLAAAGNVEAALRIAAELPEVTSERVALLVIRRALTDPGALGAIARDHEEHRRRSAPSGAPYTPNATDDLVGSAILAAFAGRVVAHAHKLLGPHVREEAERALRALLSTRPEPAADNAGAYRRPPVRAPSVAEHPDRSVQRDKKRGTA